MCHSLLCAIVEFEKHRVCNVKAGKLVQCTGRHDDLAAMIHVLSFGPGKHCNRIAAVVFIEAASCTTRAHHAAAEYALHGIIKVIRSELELLGRAQEADRSRSEDGTYHDEALVRATSVDGKKLSVERSSVQDRRKLRERDLRSSWRVLASPRVTQLRSVMIFRSDPGRETNLNGGATSTVPHTPIYSSSHNFQQDGKLAGTT